MKMKQSIIFCMIGFMCGGCAYFNKNKPISINTQQNSPIRIQIYNWPQTGKNRQVDKKHILLLPPLGIDHPDQRQRFYQHLYSGSLRRFSTPTKIIKPDSAYAPYVEDKNLIRSDGSLDIGEAAYIGALMNCSYVICPHVRELKPYHPQRIDIHLVLINTVTDEVCAEFSGVFDARESDIYEYFIEYSNARKGKNESKDDLGFKIKSPTAFQGFVSDMCGTVMAEKLSL